MTGGLSPTFEFRHTTSWENDGLRSQASRERKVVCHCSPCDSSRTNIRSREVQALWVSFSLDERRGRIRKKTTKRSKTDREVRSSWRVIKSKKIQGEPSDRILRRTVLLRRRFASQRERHKRIVRKTNGNFAEQYFAMLFAEWRYFKYVALGGNLERKYRSRT